MPFRVLNMSHLYCCRKHINSYDTNVLKQILRTLRFCLVNNIFIQKFFSSFWCIFLSLYFTLYMTGLSLWNSKHEHNTVNMLCSLKKLLYYKSYLAITATSLQGPLSFVPKVAIVERFDCIQNVQNINALIS